MTKSRAREHCRENDGRLSLTRARNWKAALSSEAREVALGEVEGEEKTV